MASDIIRSPQSTGSNGGDMSAYKYCRDRDGKVHLDVIIDGKRFRKSTGRPATPANLKYVDKNWQAEVDRILNKNKIEEVEDGEMTVEKWGYRSLLASGIDRCDNTNDDYKRAFELHIIPTFGDVPLSKVVPSDLKLWQLKLKDKDDKNLSPNRINLIATVFKTIMRDAVNDNKITKNPFDGLKIMQKKSLEEVSPFTLDEVKFLIDNADGWFKNFLAVAFFTGMRTGEMLALKWEDVNLHSEKIIVRSSMTRGKLGPTKSRKVREIDMLPPVVDALRKQFLVTGLRNEFVFIGRTHGGTAFTNSGTIAVTYWKPLLKRLLIGYRTLYQTRHTFATMMVSAGEDIMWVSSMMGHANTNITLAVYAKYRVNNSIKRAKFLDDVDLFKQKKHDTVCHVSVTS